MINHLLENLISSWDQINENPNQIMLVSELITTFSATFIEAQKCELYLAHQSGIDLI